MPSDFSRKLLLLPPESGHPHYSRGVVTCANLPSLDGGMPQAQVLQIPQLYTKDKTGRVCSMEWSSDGYALAVGWEHGWAVWSVGGRCLAWGFGVEYEVDEDR